jgi:hypothetical protein
LSHETGESGPAREANESLGGIEAHLPDAPCGAFAGDGGADHRLAQDAVQMEIR